MLILLHHLNGVTALTYLKPFGVVGIAVVSLFFFVSGYGLLASFEKKGILYLESFFKKRVLPIVCTYIGALALYLLFRAIVYGGGIVEYLKATNFTNWLPYSWFVIELLILYIFYWGFFRIKRMSIKSKITLSVSIICLCYFVMMYWDAPIYLWRSTPAFALGMIYKYNERLVLKCGRLMMILSVVVACMLFGIVNVLKFKEINFLFVCIIVFGGLSLIQVKTNGLISFLSKISFEMYLVQSIAIGIVSILYWGHIFWYCLLVIILDIVLAIILSKYSAIMKGYLMERSMMGGKKI